MLSFYPQQRFSSYYPVASAPTLSSRDRYLAALAEAKAAEEEYLREQALQREELALRRRLEEIQLRKRQNNLRHLPQRASYSEPTLIFPGFDVYDYSHVARQRQIEEENQRQVLAARQARIQAYRQKQLEQEILRNQQCRRLSGCFLDGSCPCYHPPAAVFNKAQGNNPQKPSASPLARRPACRRACDPKDRPEAAVEIDLDQLLGQMFGLPTAQKPTALASHIRRAHSVPTSQPTKKSASEIPVPIPAPASQRPQPQPRREVPVQRTHSESSLPREVEVDLAKNFEDFLKLLGIASVNEPQQPRASTSTSPTSSSKPAPAPAKATEKVTPEAPSKASESAEQTLKKELEARLNNEYETEVRDTIQALIASLHDNHVPAPSETRPTPASPSSASDKGKAKAAGEGTVEPTSKDVANSMNEVSSIETAFVALESDFSIPTQLDFDLSTASFDDAASVHSSDSEGSASTHLAYTSRNHPVRFYEQALGSLLSQLDAVPSFGNEELRKRRKEVVSKIEKALDDLEWEVQGRWRSKLAKESKAAEVSAPSSPVQETPVAAEELKEEAKQVDVAQEQAPEEQAPESVIAASEPSAPSLSTSESESQDHVAPASEPVDPVVESVEEPAVSPVEVLEPVSEEQEEIVPAASEPQEEIERPAESVVEEPLAPAAQEPVASPVEEVVAAEPSSTVVSTPEVIEEPESSYPPRSLPDSEPSSGSSSLATSTATIRPQPYEVETDSEVDEVESISDDDDVDTYLLPSSAQPEVQPRPRHDDDSASEWSEIEA